MTYKNDTIQLDTRIPVTEVIRSKVKTVDYQESVVEAAKKMCSKDIGGSCIVIKDDVAVGIVTEQDINCKVVAHNKKPGDVYVHEIMTSPLITITGDKTVEDAAHLMIKNRVRRLPITNNDGVVIGIVTVRDIITVSTAVNELMEDLIEINRNDDNLLGMCSKCGKMTDDLVNVDNNLLCESCRDDDRL